jgi:tetratricopeptide (TPR) repeat protein
MLKTRIVLIVVSALLVWLIFKLPKVVVDNESAQLGDSTSVEPSPKSHTTISPDLKNQISQLRAKFLVVTEKEKNAIFADSLASLYANAGKFDSAAWFSEEAASFFNTPESWIKAGNQYYQAYSFALDENKQRDMADMAQEFYNRVLTDDPDNLDVKTKLAMIYVNSPSPMKGISMLREVLAKDPQNKEAILNMGILSIQSGQYERAIERFEELVKIDSMHLQGQLLLGVALLNHGDKSKAKEQFEKVKEMNEDPAVQAEVDSYLNDLK